MKEFFVNNCQHLKGYKDGFDRGVVDVAWKPLHNNVIPEVLTIVFFEFRFHMTL